MEHSIDKVSRALKAVSRQIKDQANELLSNDTPLEKRLKEATSDTNWGCSSAVLAEIAKASYDFGNGYYYKIMSAIWNGLSAKPKHWRKVYKSLTLLEYLLKHGPERVLEESRSGLYRLRSLSDFHFTEDGKDKGSGVRDLTKHIIELVSDAEVLKKERLKAQAIKDRYIGIGAGGTRCGPGFTYDVDFGSTTRQYDPWNSRPSPPSYPVGTGLPSAETNVWAGMSAGGEMNDAEKERKRAEAQRQAARAQREKAKERAAAAKQNEATSAGDNSRKDNRTSARRQQTNRADSSSSSSSSDDSDTNHTNDDSSSGGDGHRPSSRRHRNRHVVKKKTSNGRSKNDPTVATTSSATSSLDLFNTDAGWSTPATSTSQKKTAFPAPPPPIASIRAGGPVPPSAGLAKITGGGMRSTGGEPHSALSLNNAHGGGGSSLSNTLPDFFVQSSTPAPPTSWNSGMSGLPPAGGLSSSLGQPSAYSALSSSLNIPPAGVSNPNPFAIQGPSQQMAMPGLSTPSTSGLSQLGGWPTGPQTAPAWPGIQTDPLSWNTISPNQNANFNSAFNSNSNSNNNPRGQAMLMHQQQMAQLNSGVAELSLHPSRVGSGGPSPQFRANF